MWKVDSTNRTQAKRLLNTWHDSRTVRIWPLERINRELRRAVNDGLITDDGIRRALNQTQNNNQSTRGQSSNDDKSASRAEESKQSASNSGDASADGEKSEGAASNANESDSDNESEDESNAQSESENGEDESDASNAESEDDDDDDDKPLQHEMFETVRRMTEAGLNVALVGPAGSGKSTLAKNVADALGLNFYAHGSLFSKFELTGYNDANGQYHASVAFEAYSKGGLHCFDEYDGSVPEAGVAFNGLIDHQTQYAFPCGMVDKHPQYRAIATMNTWGHGATSDYVGRFKLDAANANRWTFVYIDYNEKLERRLAGKENRDLVERAKQVRAACNTLGLKHIVSTRSIVQARMLRDAGFSRAQIDDYVFFARLDDDTKRQLASTITGAK